MKEGVNKGMKQTVKHKQKENIKETKIGDKGSKDTASPHPKNEEKWKMETKNKIKYPWKVSSFPSWKLSHLCMQVPSEQATSSP